MEWLSDDPTYLAGGLGLLALVSLFAMRVTQQGKYLIWACALLALAVAVVVVEQLWVTDSERIEQVVYDLAQAARASDADRALDLMTPNVQFGMRSSPSIVHGERVRSYIRQQLEATHFDALRIRHLQANAGGQSRRGTAEFQAWAAGSQGSRNFASPGPAGISLGLQETSPGVWKINRINLTRFPTAFFPTP